MKRSRFGNFSWERLSKALGLLLVAAALCHLAGIGVDYEKGPKFYQKLGHGVVSGGEEGGGQPKESDVFSTEETGSGLWKKEAQTNVDYRSVKIDFAYLKEINEDIVGWLLFDRNGISYPVLKGKENEEYLYALADKTKNDAGSIFMDALCKVDFTDPHTILYGHNRKDLTMFGKLKFYKTDPDYYQENRFFTIYTPDGYLRYEIFAWYEAAEDDEVYQAGFAADAVFADFAAQMKKRSERDTQIEVGQMDRIVTLSTCSSAGKRFVVHGKLTEGELR